MNYTIIILCIILIILLIYINNDYKRLNTLIDKKLDLIYKKPFEIKDLEYTDNIIWSYWNSKKQPLSVKVCIYSWFFYNPDCIIIVLNDDNVKDFININEFPERIKNIKIKKEQVKSDVIRLSLLEKYGGLWLDATIYLNSHIDIMWVNKTYDVGGYFGENFTTDINKKVFENWFISAPKNSALIKEWKKELFRAFNNYYNTNTYIHDLEIKDNVDLQNIGLLKYYLIMHCSFLKVIGNCQYNILALPNKSQNGPFSYLTYLEFPIDGIIKLLLTDSFDNIPIIKFRGGMDTIFLENLWFLKSKKSTLHKFLL